MSLNKFFEDYRICIFDETDCIRNPANSELEYSYIHINKVDKGCLNVTKHGINVLKDDRIVGSALVISSGGATCVHPGSAIIDNNSVLICCADSIFCLGLPHLNLLWQTKADLATCFGIYRYQDLYVVHGELEISCLTRNGKIRWSVGGKDIFVTLTGEDDFKIIEGFIYVKDWNNRVYRIDVSTGKILEVRYEILAGLPAYGLIYVSISQDEIPNFSEGFVVRFFKSDGSNWVGNFQSAWTNFSRVFDFPHFNKTVVLASGACYIMIDDNQKPSKILGVGITDVYQTADNTLVLVDQTEFIVIDINNDNAWQSDRISWDGFKDLVFSGDTVSGLAYYPSNEDEEWCRFSFNFRTNEIVGRKYRVNVKTKPWWKVW